MKTDPKILAFTQAIMAVFKEEKKNPMILENDSMPKGYFGKIRAILPTEFNWPPKDTGLSKTFNDNKQVIIDILKADKQPISEEPTQISLVQTEEPERPEQVKKPICSEQIELDILRIVNEQLDMRILELKEGLLSKQYGLELAPARSFIKGKRGKQENRKSKPIASSIDEETV